MSSNVLAPKHIRDAITAQLQAACIPGVKEKVFSGRVDKGWPHEGPYIVVIASNTNFDNGSNYTNGIYSAETSVQIVVVVQGSILQVVGPKRERIDVEDQLDVLSNAVVNALFYPGMSSEHALKIAEQNNIRLEGIESILNGDGEVKKGQSTISLQVAWSVELPSGDCEDACDEIQNTLNVAGGDETKNIVWLTPLEAL